MKRFALILLLIMAPVGAVSADENLTETQIKRLALEAILENPEIIMQAVALLERQQEDAQAAGQARALSEQRDVLEQDPNAPVLGNPEGDVTVVEFFDYNCPYCKRAMDEVRSLLEADPNIRLVYREWPILGDGSVFAAKAALASRNQGKYEAFHWALMGFKGRAQEASVMRIAKEVGLDLDQLRQDMESPEVLSHIDTSMQLSKALGFNGTPSFVIGENLVGGFVEKPQLDAFVAEARAGAE